MVHRYFPDFGNGHGSVLQPVRDIEDNNKIKLLWKKHEQPHWYLNVFQLSRAWLKT